MMTVSADSINNIEHILNLADEFANQINQNPVAIFLFSEETESIKLKDHQKSIIIVSTLQVCKIVEIFIAKLQN